MLDSCEQGRGHIHPSLKWLIHLIKLIVFVEQVELVQFLMEELRGAEGETLHFQTVRGTGMRSVSLWGCLLAAKYLD